MVSRFPPPQENERKAPLLPTTGIDAESAFDLPYAVDPLDQLPPPPRPAGAVLPPTFSAPPRPLDDQVPRTPVPSAPAPIPAPISAGSLASSLFADEDVADEISLPPMVAKGGWDAPKQVGRELVPDYFDRADLSIPHATSAGPSDTARSSEPSAPTDRDSSLDHLFVGTSPPATSPETSNSPPPAFDLSDSILEADRPHAAPAPAPERSTARPPDVAATVEQVGAPAPPPPPPPAYPTGALAFSPDVQLPDSRRGGTTNTGSGISGGPAQWPESQPPGWPGIGTIAPLAPTPDPRMARGPAVVVSESRISDGLLVSAAAAVIAGVVWWAVVAMTGYQIPYVAIVLGIVVGQAALVGGRKGSIGLGLVAGSVTLLSLTATQYFITRSLAISDLGAQWNLWEGASVFQDVIRSTFEEEPSTGLFVLLAAGIAGFQAGVPGRRASGALGEVRVSRAPDRIL